MILLANINFYVVWYVWYFIFCSITTC